MSRALILPACKPNKEERQSCVDWLVQDFMLRYPHILLDANSFMSYLMSEWDADLVGGLRNVTGLLAKRIHVCIADNPDSKRLCISMEAQEDGTWRAVAMARADPPTETEQRVAAAAAVTVSPPRPVCRASPNSDDSDGDGDEDHEMEDAAAPQGRGELHDHPQEQGKSKVPDQKDGKKAKAKKPRKSNQKGQLDGDGGQLQADGQPQPAGRKNAKGAGKENEAVLTEAKVDDLLQRAEAAFHADESALERAVPVGSLDQLYAAFQAQASGKGAPNHNAAAAMEDLGSEQESPAADISGALQSELASCNKNDSKLSMSKIVVRAHIGVVLAKMHAEWDERTRALKQQQKQQVPAPAPAAAPNSPIAQDAIEGVEEAAEEGKEEPGAPAAGTVQGHPSFVAFISEKFGINSSYQPKYKQLAVLLHNWPSLPYIITVQKGMTQKTLFAWLKPLEAAIRRAKGADSEDRRLLTAAHRS
jgi:hypothetical protein